MSAETVIDVVGATPLVRLEHLVPHNGSEVWVKLEGNNPAGSIKDRAARSMIERLKSAEISSRATHSLKRRAAIPASRSP